MEWCIELTATRALTLNYSKKLDYNYNFRRGYHRLQLLSSIQHDSGVSTVIRDYGQVIRQTFYIYIFGDVNFTED